MWLSDCIDLVLLDRPRRRKRNRRKPLRRLVLQLPGSFFSEDRDNDDSSAAGPLTLTVSAPGELISLPPRLHCTGQSMVLRLCVELVVARWVRRRRWGFKGAGRRRCEKFVVASAFLCVSHPASRRVIKTQFNTCILLSFVIWKEQK